MHRRAPKLRKRFSACGATPEHSCKRSTVHPAQPTVYGISPSVPSGAERCRQPLNTAPLCGALGHSAAHFRPRMPHESHPRLFWTDDGGNVSDIAALMRCGVLGQNPAPKRPRLPQPAHMRQPRTLIGNHLSEKVAYRQPTSQGGASAPRDALAFHPRTRTIRTQPHPPLTGKLDL